MNADWITLPLMFVAGVVCYIVLTVATINQPRAKRTSGVLMAAVVGVLIIGMLFGFYLFARGIGFYLTDQVERLDVFDSLAHWLAFAVGISAAYAVDEVRRTRRTR